MERPATHLYFEVEMNAAPAHSHKTSGRTIATQIANSVRNLWGIFSYCQARYMTPMVVSGNYCQKP